VSRAARIVIIVAVAWIVLFTLGYIVLFNSGGTAPESGRGDRIEARQIP
jgi:hypothetical protein